MSYGSSVSGEFAPDPIPYTACPVCGARVDQQTWDEDETYCERHALLVPFHDNTISPALMAEAFGDDSPPQFREQGAPDGVSRTGRASTTAERPEPRAASLSFRAPGPVAPVRENPSADEPPRPEQGCNPDIPPSMSGRRRGSSSAPDRRAA